MRQYRDLGDAFQDVETGTCFPVGHRQHVEMLEAIARGEAELLPADPPPEPTYRELRAIAYRDELGKEQGDFVKTVGDVLDVLIKEQRARGEAVTEEAAALYAKVDAIKARYPKPAPEE